MENLNNYYKKLNRPCSLQEILSTEARIGFSLPDPYRDFLLKSNGGELSDETSFFQININNKDLNDSLVELVAIDSLEGGYFTFVDSEKEEGFPDYFHHEMIRIADTQGGGCILMGYKSDNYGVIYWINYIWYDDELMPIRLADSLEKFLESLTSYGQLFGNL